MLSFWQNFEHWLHWILSFWWLECYSRNAYILMSPQVCEPPRASYNIWWIKKIYPSANVFFVLGKREKISCKDSYVFSTPSSHIRSFAWVIFIPSLVVMVTKKVPTHMLIMRSLKPMASTFYRDNWRVLTSCADSSGNGSNSPTPPYTMIVKVRAFKFTPGTIGFFHTSCGHQSMQNRSKDHGKCNTCMLNKLQVKDQSRSYSHGKDGSRIWSYGWCNDPSLIERQGRGWVRVVGVGDGFYKHISNMIIIVYIYQIWWISHTIILLQYCIS